MLAVHLRDDRKPKGVLLNHRSLVNVAKLTLGGGGRRGRLGMPETPLPMFHTAGCVIANPRPAVDRWHGGSGRTIRRPRAGGAAPRGRRRAVLRPAILGALLECQRTASTPAPKLRVIMAAPSNVSASMIESGRASLRRVGRQPVRADRTCARLVATRPSDSRADQLTTVGRPLPRVECKIVDPATNETLAVGETR